MLKFSNFPQVRHGTRKRCDINIIIVNNVTYAILMGYFVLEMSKKKIHTHTQQSAAIKRENVYYYVLRGQIYKKKNHTTYSHTKYGR